jgi:hypothetical protein
MTCASAAGAPEARRLLGRKPFFRPPLILALISPLPLTFTFISTFTFTSTLTLTLTFTFHPALTSP